MRESTAAKLLPLSFLVVVSFFFATNCMAQTQSRKSAVAPQSQKTSDIKIRMPENADTPVLTMDTYGGFRMKSAENFEPTPELQIFADGRIVTGRKSDKVKEVVGSIDLVELQPLLRFIVDECHFFEISTESLKADLAKKGALKIMDAATTRIAINLKDHSNEVEAYGLQVYAAKYTDVPSFASIVAIASRCRPLASRIKLGSDEEAEVALGAVNKELVKKNPKSQPFVMADLQFAEQFVDGKRTATFVKKYEENNKSFTAYATFQVDDNGAESTTADVYEQTPRRNR